MCTLSRLVCITSVAVDVLMRQYSIHVHVVLVRAKFLNLNMIMPAKYFEDLRWRAVWLHLIRGWSADEIADVLFICKRSVERYQSLCHATGSVAPRNQQHGPPHLLIEFEQVAVLQSLIIKPTMYLEEL